MAGRSRNCSRTTLVLKFVWSSGTQRNTTQNGFFSSGKSRASIGVTDEVEEIRRVATNPGAVLLLAVLGDDIVGTLLGTYDGWRGNMYRLVVHPARRCQGIARELVRRVEQVFAEWGVRRITVLIEVERPWAVAFWISVGYPRDERIVRHLGILDSRTATTPK